MKNNVRVRLLKVMRCQDAMMWYAPLVGEYVPCLGLDHGEWRSRQPSGYSNFIAQDNARVVHVFVSPDKLGEYPYKYAQVERPVQPQQDVPTAAKVAPKPTAKTGCKARCDVLGVCHDLPDCEDALGRARGANPKPPTAAPAMGQSHRASAVEAATNIVIGFVVSMVIQAVVLPAMGHHITIEQNFLVTCIFTVASLIRSYLVRRLFVRIA